MGWLRRLFRRKPNPRYTWGVMWEYDHARPLGYAEYLYWTRHPLPFGWAIISAASVEGEK